MSDLEIDPAIQHFLNKLVDSIEAEIISTGYAVPRSEIMGYLLEFFVVDANLTEERLNLLAGDVAEITQDIISRKDVEWPQAPWYGREIIYPMELTEAPGFDQATSSQLMRFYQYVQGVLMLPSLYVLILVLWSFSLALIRQDPNSFEISGGLDFSPLNWFFYYGIYSLVIFPLTARISNNKLLRSGVDDMEGWLTDMRKLAYFQTFSYGMFSFMMFMGSFAVVKIGTSQTTITEKPANGIELSTTLTYILFTTVIYYIGIKRLWTKASGGSLRKIVGKPKHRIISSGIFSIQVIQNLIIISIATLTILLIRGISRLTDEPVVILNREIAFMVYFSIFLTFVYGLINGLLTVYFTFTNPNQYSIMVRRNLLRNNFLQSINMFLFASVYIYFKFQIKLHQNVSFTVLEVILAFDVFGVVALIIIYLIMLWAVMRFSKEHQDQDIYEDVEE